MEGLDTKTGDEFLHVSSGILDRDIPSQMETMLVLESGVRLIIVVSRIHSIP